LAKVKDILSALFEFAPEEAKLSFDNVGHLVGDENAEVSKILLALDVTTWTVQEAAQIGAQLIVVHHPVVYGEGVKSVTTATTTGRRILALAENKISAISMHTNLDAAPDGVNQAIAEKLGLTDLTLPDVDPRDYSEGTRFAGQKHVIARAGYTKKPLPMSEFLKHVKDALGVNGLRYYDAGIPVHHVGIIGGSGDTEIDTIISHGCDTFVTGEVRYKSWLEAKERGINLIDADHYGTENSVLPKLMSELNRVFPEIEVVYSKSHEMTAQYYV